MTLRCTRCSGQVMELWSTVEMFSRVGNFRAVDLCRACTAVAYSFVLNRPLTTEDPLTITDYLRDPEDIDDAEHAGYCRCHECDPDFHMELMREERYIEEAS